MTERLYAKDLAVLEGVSVQRAREILRDLERKNPRAVGRDGRSRFTSRRHLDNSHEPEGDERIDKLTEALEAIRGETQAMDDMFDSMARQVGALEARLAIVERRV